MSNIDQHRKALIARVTNGEGKADPEQRAAAFAGKEADAAALLEKVTKHAHKVTDEDIAAVKAAGVTEDQIFELVVCAAIGEANRQLETALAALDEATKEESRAAAGSR